jgi:hypothetical protein
LIATHSASLGQALERLRYGFALVALCRERIEISLKTNRFPISNHQFRSNQTHVVSNFDCIAAAG